VTGEFYVNVTLQIHFLVNGEWRFNGELVNLLLVVNWLDLLLVNGELTRLFLGDW